MKRIIERINLHDVINLMLMILAFISALFMMLDIGNGEASSKIFVFTMGFFSKNVIVKKE